MRVDELNDETERAMDEMTDRIRALEAERDAEKLNRQGVEDELARTCAALVNARDAEVAAVKRAEEAERRFREAMLKKADDLSRLLGQLSEAEAREGRLEEVLRGARESITIARQVFPAASVARGSFEGAFLGVDVKIDAALSPSPVSADDCEHDTEPAEGGGLVCKRCRMAFLACPGCSEAGGADRTVYHAPPLCPVGTPSSVSALFPGVPLKPHDGPVTYEPQTTLPDLVSRAAAKEPDPRCPKCGGAPHLFTDERCEPAPADGQDGA